MTTQPRAQIHDRRSIPVVGVPDTGPQITIGLSSFLDRPTAPVDFVVLDTTLLPTALGEQGTPIGPESRCRTLAHILQSRAACRARRDGLFSQAVFGVDVAADAVSVGDAAPDANRVRQDDQQPCVRELFSHLRF